MIIKKNYSAQKIILYINLEVLAWFEKQNRNCY